MKNAGIIMAVVSFFVFAIFGIVLNLVCCNVPVALALGAIAGNYAVKREGSSTTSKAASDGVKAGLLSGIGAAAGSLVAALLAGGVVAVGSAVDTSVANQTATGLTGFFSVLILGFVYAGINTGLEAAGGALGGWFHFKNSSPVGAVPSSGGRVIDVTPSRPAPSPRPPAAIAPPPSRPASPDISGGRFPRHAASAGCEVCTKSLPAGEGYEVPADIFFGSKPYQDWLANSPLGQMIIPSAGGMDTYLQKARSRKGANPAIVCADCLPLFPASLAAPVSPAVEERRAAPPAASRMTVSERPAPEKPARKRTTLKVPAGPDASGGKFPRLGDEGVCDVCAAEMDAGEGYRIPVDVFYRAEKYRQWLVDSPQGQIAIPMAGGIDAYIQAARAKDDTDYSGVCGVCVHLFL